jgi:hypothetical protein
MPGRVSATGFLGKTGFLPRGVPRTGMKQASTLPFSGTVRLLSGHPVTGAYREPLGLMTGTAPLSTRGAAGLNRRGTWLRADRKPVSTRPGEGAVMRRALGMGPVSLSEAIGAERHRALRMALRMMGARWANRSWGAGA